MKFPSAEWFQALQGRAGANQERFKKLGFVDAAVGIKVQPDNGGAPAGFVLEFAGYGCKKVTTSAQPAEAADFVVEGKYSAWKEMIENIRANGEADLEHTLNVLTLPGVPFKLEAADQLKADLFFRYNQTLQEFFNCAADIETEFDTE
jgi:hypothetical protein